MLCLSPAFILVSFLAYSSTLKTESTCSYETSVDSQRATWGYIPEDWPLWEPQILQPNSRLMDRTILRHTYSPKSDQFIFVQLLVICLLASIQLDNTRRSGEVTLRIYRQTGTTEVVRREYTGISRESWRPWRRALLKTPVAHPTFCYHAVASRSLRSIAHLVFTPSTRAAERQVVEKASREVSSSKTEPESLPPDLSPLLSSHESSLLF
jgi:hypothetical protein